MKILRFSEYRGTDSLYTQISYQNNRYWQTSYSVLLYSGSK